MKIHTSQSQPEHSVSTHLYLLTLKNCNNIKTLSMKSAMFAENVIMHSLNKVVEKWAKHHRRV